MRLWPALTVFLFAPVLAADEVRHWAYRPLTRPPVPVHAGHLSSPIDAFIADRLTKEGLTPSPRAADRVLLRRLWFDTVGLPPPVAELEVPLDEVHLARRLDQLLASPRYGERQARSYLDLVHFAETHGHDEDAVRENAWPFRDYVIRSFNEDKPWGRFLAEQVAGDVLWPEDPWATIATGLLAAGPWDESSQMGIQDGTLDKEKARVLDRDDMIATVLSSFTSTTAHCARCHDHKFDPIPTEDYYALQAVFAGLDRVDRPVDRVPGRARERRRIEEERRALERRELPDLDAAREREFEAWTERLGKEGSLWSVIPPERIETQGTKLTPLPDRSLLASGPRPERDVYRLEFVLPDAEDVVALQLEVLADPSLPQGGPGRQDNGNLHLSEIVVRHGEARLEIAHARADFDQGGWTVKHAIDGVEKTAWGIFPQVGASHRAVFEFRETVRVAAGDRLTVELHQLHGGGHLIGRPRLAFTSTRGIGPRPPLPLELTRALERPAAARSVEERHALLLHYLRERNEGARESLPPPALVYAVTSHFQPKGNFKPARGPRPVHVLERGDVAKPGARAEPGALSLLDHLPARFEKLPEGDEGARRAALARWLAAPENVLVWRSAANRVWQQHFGRGLVATPNDFGKMGARPSHPALLDWLACELRDSGGSVKQLRRLILSSETYARSSTPSPRALASDPENRLLARAPRRRLEAECFRDAVLALSGDLDLRQGGPSARQFTSKPGIHVTPIVDYLGFDPGDPANFRRGIYRFVFRTLPDPLMQALDCPDASQLTPARAESVTALQALATLNQSFLIEQYARLAERLESEFATPAERIRRLYLRALARAPEPGELEDCLRFVEAQGLVRLARLARVVLNTNEFFFLD